MTTKKPGGAKRSAERLSKVNVKERDEPGRNDAESRLPQQEIIDQRFPYAMLIIPRVNLQETQVTTAQAAVRRAFRHEELELRVPEKSTANALQRIGMEDIEKVQATGNVASRRGVFARLNSIGMTAAFFGQEKDEANALNELSEQYDFVPDFHLSIPSRVRMDAVPATKGRTAPTASEWPEASGVARAHELGIRGEGVLVGVLDTGIDADHQEFARQNVTYRYVSLYPNSPYWPPRDVRGFDTGGHGTHVCGIVAGQQTGVAPEASLYVASVIESETTRTSMIRVAYGLDWILRHFSSPDNEHRPAVLNMSLGFPETAANNIPKQEYEQRLRALRILLRTLVQANVLPVVAIGNEGPGTFGYPGAFKEVLSVGAVDFEENVASFSGDGKPPDEGVTKPDVVGYGVGVYSSLERNYAGDSIYKRENGTSMATPYVSGIAALYRCQQPTLMAKDIWQKLLDTARPLTPKNRTGAGLATFAE